MKLPTLKIYVQLLNKGCRIYESNNGDLFDLRAASTVTLTAPYTDENSIVNFVSERIPLGVRILLPEGCKADVVARSGTYDKYNIVLANGEGKIDYSYNGPTDEWKSNYIAFDSCTINGGRKATKQDYDNPNLTIIDGWVQGDRIAQFEVTLSQKATFMQKLKWLFHSGIEVVYVDDIDTIVSRGGFGSSGIK